MIGDGYQIPLTHPNWFKCSNHNLIRNNLLGGIVADLINQNKRTWNHTLIRKLYQPHISKEIMQLHIPRTFGLEDKLLWRHSNSGEYKVNKAYSMIHQKHYSSMGQEERRHVLPHTVCMLLWKVKLPYKILTFIWKILHGSLLVFETLNKRGIRTNNLCLMCNEEKESIDHLFLYCLFTRAIWYGSNLEVRTSDLIHTLVDF